MTYGRLLMLDLSFGLLIAQWGIEVHLWSQQEKYNLEIWGHLGALSFCVFT